MKKLVALILIAFFISGCGDTQKAEYPTGEAEPAIMLNPASPSEPLSELPAHLVWMTNNDDPVFSDPSALKGGTFRDFITSFPLTLRYVGPDSNGSFAGYVRATQLSLLDMHPNTGNPLPSLATHWAFDEDGKTVYFKLDPDARWSDGLPVTADDYTFTLEFMRSKFIVAPWYNEHFTTQITDIKKYDNYTISVTAGSAKPRDELLLEGVNLRPIPRHFHKLDENWVRNYNWKVEPGTAAYTIGEIRKGKYIEFLRLDNWWARDKRYYKNRFNVDKIKVKVIRDINIAWKHFLKGDLDTFGLVLPSFWHDKAKGKNFERGYIHKIKFYNDVPQPAQGIWMNMDYPLLKDKNIREAIAYAMNFDKVLTTVLRNDYERMETHNVGYGDYTNTAITPRAFDLKKSDSLLKAAGWIDYDSDGIRIKNGQRLSFELSYGSAHHTERLVVLKEEAKKAGIELVLKVQDSSAFFKGVLEKKHQIVSLGWGGGGLSPSYYQFYHSDNSHKPQTNNITNFDDPEMDALIDAYRVELDKKNRIELAHQIEQKIYDSAALIPTWKVPYTRAAFWGWVNPPAFYGTKSSQVLFDPMGEGLFWIDKDKKDSLRKAMRSGKTFPVETIIDETWRKKRDG
ncbi:MAG: ABC transporter substrate-binding protein [Pseudomonadales bacterium]|nr:ABC transporter substrate-binding protein [Pseudomonadales bacterium]